MRYLVDANVLSEPTRPVLDAKVVEWLRWNEREIAIDPVIAAQRQEARHARAVVRGRRSATALSALGSGEDLEWAQLLAHLPALGRAMPIKHSLIAATALLHGLAVVTRNRADFEQAWRRHHRPVRGLIRAPSSGNAGRSP